MTPIDNSFGERPAALRRVQKLVVQLALCLATAGSAWADVKIGQTAGVTGAVAASVKEATQGAKLYFDAVNARGGLNGEPIRLISLDDKFDPKLAVANAKALIDQGVIALFLNRGTPHTQAIMPLLVEHAIPLVGPSTGAMVLHSPVHPWLFNVRATYQREAERAVSHLSLVGIERIARASTRSRWRTRSTTAASRISRPSCRRSWPPTRRPSCSSARAPPSSRA
jgi:branched-chain amino acid transport system substrate-binding protein